MAVIIHPETLLPPDKSPNGSRQSNHSFWRVHGLDGLEPQLQFQRPSISGRSLATSLHTSARLPLAVRASPSSRSTAKPQSPPVLSLLSVCLPACLSAPQPHFTNTTSLSNTAAAALFSALTAAPLDILCQYHTFPQANNISHHLPNPHQRSGGRARPAPFSLARQFAFNLATDHPHSFTTRHHRPGLIISNGFE
jgi:hypothetical protein